MSNKEITGIAKAMAQEIDSRHLLALEQVEEARKAVRKATETILGVGTLLSRVQRDKRETLHNWACTHTSVTGEQSRAYISAHAAGEKRDVANDKRILQIVGILDKAPPRKARTRAMKPSASQQVNKATAALNKSLKDRSVDQMSKVERMQLREATRQIATLFVRLSE